MTAQSNINLWTRAEHAPRISRADSIPRRTEGEAALLEFLRPMPGASLIWKRRWQAARVGEGGSSRARLVAVDFLANHVGDAPEALCIGRQRDHRRSRPGVSLARLGSSIRGLQLAIHHVPHDRKRRLYEEVFNLLIPGGVFCN